ncbi:hypothetical protein OJF2_13900 [Aquisphaera giovannonii]|uniref:Uncharacterized protein n=1 Tax=Aquisphaera giovannonii TaxID=406548 RepID=A0A5B9VYU2_9BACT|nr:hypothetical protein [Aquisphaera giovannonii]QEH32905.1 hypothetical protein OJF2_13900 [Aquisphaera giovannonii]
MIYLSDNDIVEKLAICDLLDDALRAFDATRADVLVVPTLKNRIGIGMARPKVIRRLGAEVADRLMEFLGTVREVNDYSYQDHDLLESLDDSVEIDAGEIVLLSATAKLGDYLLLTGDKRCLKAVASCPECEHIAKRIRGRVVCFEQIILRIIDVDGYDAVKAKVIPVLHACDTALRAAFGSGMHATQSNTCDCLQSYIAEIRAFPIDLLMDGH